VPRILRLLLLLSVAAPAAWAAAPVPPRPDRYATDRAGVADASRMAALNETLAQFERETSNQVLVYLDRRLPPNTSLEEFAAEAFKAWGVGQKGKDNGVVVFAFVDDRKFRIEVGYGLEGAIPDARARAIQEEQVLPRFKKGDFAGGLESGAAELMKAARGEAYAGTGKTVAETGPPGAPPSPWMLLIPLAAVALGWLLGRPGADGVTHWLRGGVLAGVFSIVGTVVAAIAVQNPNGLMLAFVLPLFMAAAALPPAIAAGTTLAGRRRVGLALLQAAAGSFFLALGLLFLGVVWAGFATAGVCVALALPFLLLLGGVLVLENLVRSFTVLTGRLSFVAMIPVGLYFGLCVVAQSGGIASSGAVTLAFFGSWFVAWRFARAHGWRLIPKLHVNMAGGSGGSSWSSSSGSGSSSWSSSSSSGRSGSSFSGGGGRSGGGGSSGSW
jgi:uncharacterized protein